MCYRPSPYILSISSLFDHVEDKSELRDATSNFLPQFTTSLFSWLNARCLIVTPSLLQDCLPATFTQHSDNITYFFNLCRLGYLNSVESYTQIFSIWFTAHTLIGISQGLLQAPPCQPNLDSAFGISDSLYYEYLSTDVLRCTDSLCYCL